MNSECGCEVINQGEHGWREQYVIRYCQLHASAGKLLEAAKEAYSTLSGLESILPRITGDLRQAIAAAERKP